MFIDFTVENYRSIKEPVTLSAVAQSHGANEQDNRIAEPFSYPPRKLEILPVLGIFGANASGKSNVINALGNLLSSIHYNLHYLDDYRASYTLETPFKLDGEWTQLPSRFELRVLANGNIYIYTLALNKHRILHEKMSYIPKDSKRATSRLLYERTWMDALKEYSVKNGSDFGEKYRELQLSVKDSQIFLGLVAGNLNNEFLNPFISWITFYAAYAGVRGGSNDDEILACILLTPTANKSDIIRKVTMILKKFDTGIEDVEIVGPRFLGKEHPEFEIWVTHKTKAGNVKWLLSEESLGTRQLFTLAARLFNVLRAGGIVLIDELGFGTHPKINREIVRLFQDKKINKKGAQLIFTSHDTTLLSKGLLRRDQIWFTQKREDGSTELYPLSDFAGIRSDLVIDKAYLDGRFGAVPFLPDKEELTELLGV